MEPTRTGKQAARLEAVRRRFELWRSERQGRERIPERLWTAAVKVAATQGLWPAARTLRLDYYALKKRVEAAGPSAAPVGRILGESAGPHDASVGPMLREGAGPGETPAGRVPPGRVPPGKARGRGVSTAREPERDPASRFLQSTASRHRESTASTLLQSTVSSLLQSTAPTLLDSVAETPADTQRKRTCPPTFIELPPLKPLGSSECIIEMEHPRGAKMRIRFTGRQGPELVAAVSRVFLSTEA